MSWLLNVRYAKPCVSAIQNTADIYMVTQRLKYLVFSVLEKLSQETWFGCVLLGTGD